MEDGGRTNNIQVLISLSSFSDKRQILVIKTQIHLPQIDQTRQTTQKLHLQLCSVQTYYSQSNYNWNT